MEVTLDPGGDGGAPWGYGFRAGDRVDPAAPDGITLVGAGPGAARVERPTFINTSLHFLNRFDYLFDAARGLVGYRRRD